MKTGWLYKLNTPQLKRLNRAQNGRGTYFKQNIVENTGNKCYIPATGHCFTKCINFLTNSENTDEF